MDDSRHTKHMRDSRIHQLCRICTQPLRTSRGRTARGDLKKRFVENCKEDITKYFALDIATDVADQHSSCVCQSCYLQICDLNTSIKIKLSQFTSICIWSANSAPIDKHYCSTLSGKAAGSNKVINTKSVWYITWDIWLLWDLGATLGYLGI